MIPEWIIDTGKWLLVYTTYFEAAVIGLAIIIAVFRKIQRKPLPPRLKKYRILRWLDTKEQRVWALISTRKR